MSVQKFAVPTEKRASGVAVVTYPDMRWSRCDIKTVNLIPAVLAKQHAVECQAFESIFVRNGTITEGSHTNCFGVIDGELRTYPASNYILGGVTRDVVLEIARNLGIPVREHPMFMTDVPRLQEFFVTGTTTDVMPVVSFDGATIGDGKPGPITMKLYHALAAKLYAHR